MHTRVVVSCGLLAAFSGGAFAQALPADCSAAAAPKQALQVSVGGAKFTPKVVKLRGEGLRKYGDDEFDSYRLALRSEDDISPPMESEVVIIVRKGQSLDGRVFRRLPIKETRKQPAPVEGLPEVQGWSFKDRPGKGNFNHVEHVASMRLEFGKRKGDAIEGSIALCVPKGQTTIFNKTPTKEDSYAIGAFQARIEK